MLTNIVCLIFVLCVFAVYRWLSRRYDRYLQNLRAEAQAARLRAMVFTSPRHAQRSDDATWIRNK